MRVDVLQAVALACHAQPYLADGSTLPPDMLANSTFANVYEVVFERVGTTRLAGGVLADAPAPWLRRLAKEGVDRLRVTLASCPLDPLAQATEPWGILSDGDTGVELWQPEWKKRIGSHRDGHAWRVCYAASRYNRWNLAPGYDLNETAALLKSAIQHAAMLDPLVARLLVATDSDLPDLFPADWPDMRRQLGVLAARVVMLLRSETWAQVLHDRHLTPAMHSDLSQQLWKPALIALETAARLEEPAAEYPTGHSLRLAG